MTLPPGPARDAADALGEVIRLRSEIRAAFATVGVEFPVPSTILPPPRPELESSHNWAKLADSVAEAVKEGIARPDTTPEEMVRKVIADEEARRAEAKELARLRQSEKDRLDAVAQAKKDRRKIVVSVAAAVLGGLATFGAVEMLKSLVALHH